MGLSLSHRHSWYLLVINMSSGQVCFTEAFLWENIGKCYRLVSRPYQYFFHLEIILNLWKRCKNSTEFSYTLYSASDSVNNLHDHSIMIKTKKLTWVQYYWSNHGLYLDFTSFFLFLFQDSNQDPTLHFAIMSPYSPLISANS